MKRTIFLFFIFCFPLSPEKENFIKNLYIQGFMDGWIYVLKRTEKTLLGAPKENKELKIVIKENWEDIRDEISKIADSLSIGVKKEHLYIVYSEGFIDGIFTGIKDIEEKIPRDLNESKLAEEMFKQKKRYIIELLK